MFKKLLIAISIIAFTYLPVDVYGDDVGKVSSFIRNILGGDTFERELLQDHKGSYVAIYREEIIGIGENQEELAEMIFEKYGSVEALICRIEEEEGPIQMPPPREVVE